MRSFPFTARRVLSLIAPLLLACPAGLLHAVPQVESLSRGLAVVQQADGRVFLSWRLLADDPAGVAFNVYRTTTLAEGVEPFDYGIYASTPEVPAGTVKLNAAPLTQGTWFIDAAPALHHATRYTVRAVVDGVEQAESRPVTIAAGAPPLAYHRVPLQNPPGYQPLEASAGDLDGDGDYELVLMQAGRAFDNSRSGRSDPPILQAYRLDGTLLWQINLGRNIRAGAHYTQFMVFDLDGDGLAELVCKTADGTVDGVGKVIGDPAADHVNAAGHVLRGPEFLTVFDGRNGAAIDTVPYEPARHPTNPLAPTGEELKAVWGDGNGNRSDRYLAGVAYLDGTRPSVIMARGYYTRSTLAAYDLIDRKLVKRWLFDSHAGPASNRAYAGQGNHSLSVADVDGDGRDEIIYGAAVIDDDGTGLYSTGWGHGDALHVSDFHYGNPGLEVVAIQERFSSEGLSLRDAASGRPLFTVPSRKANEDGGDKGEGPGRGVAINIDPRFPGAELWAIGAGLTDIYSAEGAIIGQRPEGMPANFAIWWDGDLLRELLDQTFIAKWNWETGGVDRLLTAHECLTSNGTKATPVLSLDLWGDWREEVIWRTRDGSALHIYTSTYPTEHRLVTLMQDPQYRCAIAWQNVAYNQPPHPSFALDPSLPLPTPRAVTVVKPKAR
jgi:rhamnogalacturonan endolyase